MLGKDIWQMPSNDQAGPDSGEFSHPPSQVPYERLAEAFQSFQSIIDTIRDGIVAIDRSSNIRVFNRAAEEIFGYKAEEVVGQNVTLLMPEDARSGHEAFVRQAEIHAPSIIDQGRDLRGKRKDGSLFPLELTVSQTELNGKAVYVAVCRDISARKQAETELLEKTSTLELLYLISEKANRAVTGSEAMASSVRDVCVHTGWPVGHIYIRDEIETDRVNSSRIWYLADTKKYRAFQRASEATDFAWDEGLPGRVLASAQPLWFKDIQNDPRFPRRNAAKEAGLRTGFAIPVMARNEVIAVLEFYCCESREEDHSLLSALTTVGAQLGRAVERRRASKAVKKHEQDLEEHVETLSRAQEELEEKGRQLSANRDRLELEVAKRTEELAEALEQEQEYNALQRQFIGMASHEFRTPITIIDGEMRRIIKRSETIEPGEIVERGKRVRGEVKRINDLIDSTLSLTCLDEGKVDLKLESCNLERLIASLCGVHLTLAPDNQILFMGADLPEEIIADPQLLKQVFTNLLSNAIKYSGGSPLIEVNGRTDGQMAVVTIRDQGLGIPADELPRMFQRFFRARTSTGIPGTGIGLTVVKEFVERHGGNVSVESEEGEGTTFTIRLLIDGPPVEADTVMLQQVNQVS